MSVRWTRRRNGKLMATIIVKHHIDKDLIDWLMTTAAISEPKAMRFVRDNIDNIVGESSMDFSIGVNDGVPEIVHTTDEDDYEGELYT